MGEKTITLREGEEYITLQILLKISGIISTGGMAKLFLTENAVYVNNEKENRRGRKLYPGDNIQVQNTSFVIRAK
ncbi:MAG: S4 domain-containing protein YaaA [Bacilli bacterium]|jgi:ribosome-associated protein|nr:S4 domain-containing protein YaaA [Bacilli bacterium]MDD3069001.1 S4 domain-containing protein YaaA [Bacilli bacterium]MDD3841113.1 S4 domain-containing protein YaaA [Bacilli bacterium]HKM10040.1 S4 domain-containing protein YaaA [Bacilli bacterium]